MSLVPPEDMNGRMFHVLDSAHEHAAALGRLVGQWNALERLLIHILSYLLSTDWHKARMVYEEFVSARSKIILLRRLNYYFNKDEAIKTELNQYLGIALKLNSKRNAYIHSSWGGSSDEILRTKNIPPSDYKKPKDHPRREISPQDIQEVVNEIARLSLSFYDLIYRIHGFSKEQMTK